jgi:hypothetical protein
VNPFTPDMVVRSNVANLETHESRKGDWSMNTHVRLVSSEDTNDDADIHGRDASAGARDDKPIGLPEENIPSRSNVLGDTPPPLVVEREDRLADDRSAKVKSNTALAKLFSLAWPPKTKPSTPNLGEGTACERSDDALAFAKAPLAEDGIDTEENRAPDGAAVVTASDANRPSVRRKRALVAALAAGVVIPVIVLLNWPRNAPPPIVEPGMLADRAKLMAPSAAFATAPPREAPNVSRDRPIVHETRRDELSEMLSFKGAGSAPAEASTPANPSVTPTSPPPRAGDKTQALGPSKAASAATEAQRSASGASGSSVHAAAYSPDFDTKSPEAVVSTKLSAPTQERPALQPAALTASPSPAAIQPQEPGLGATAKIEARLTDLETALKDRSNEARARLEAEKAEAHTLEKIAELGALVARLTGQVRDVQDEVQTISTVETEKFADLTRRVALGEATARSQVQRRQGPPAFPRRPKRMGP